MTRCFYNFVFLNWANWPLLMDGFEYYISVLLGCWAYESFIISSLLLLFLSFFF